MIKMIQDEFKLVGEKYVFRKMENESILNYQYFTKYSEQGFGHSNSYLSRTYGLPPNKVKRLNHDYKWTERMNKYEKWFLRRWINTHFPSNDGKWIYDSKRKYNLQPWYQQENELNWQYFCFTIYILLNKNETYSIPKTYEYILRKYPYIISKGRNDNINQPVLKRTFVQIGTNLRWKKRIGIYYSEEKYL